MSWSNRQSPSVTMSSPATSCSRRYTESASTYCSRKRDVTIASRNDRVPRFSVYQLGLGSDPVIVVGRSFPAVAFSMRVSPSGEFRHQTVQRRGPGTHVLFRSGRTECSRSSRVWGSGTGDPELPVPSPESQVPKDLELDVG